MPGAGLDRDDRVGCSSEAAATGAWPGLCKPGQAFASLAEQRPVAARCRWLCSTTASLAAELLLELLDELNLLLAAQVDGGPATQ